ncbi:hypothetical protein HD806DRAFT_541349 [Xylariaceae sp. AK1471]|nr:hypothetical protein HD806DRAFT_541349 [Xylariaceae sp. AK1471]
MSWQPSFPKRTPQGASNGTSPSSRPPPSANPRPQHHQAVGTLQTPAQAHLNSARFVVDPFAPMHAQPEVDSEWQHPASSTARPQHSADRDDSKDQSERDTKASCSNTDAAGDDGKRKGEGKGVEKQVDRPGSIGAAEQNKANKEADSDDKGQPKSIWERKAASLGGHDGNAPTARDRTPLPWWLRYDP